MSMNREYENRKAQLNLNSTLTLMLKELLKRGTTVVQRFAVGPFNPMEIVGTDIYLLSAIDVQINDITFPTAGMGMVSARDVKEAASQVSSLLQATVHSLNRWPMHVEQLHVDIEPCVDAKGTTTTMVYLDLRFKLVSADYGQYQVGYLTHEEDDDGYTIELYYREENDAANWIKFDDIYKDGQEELEVALSDLGLIYRGTASRGMIQLTNDDITAKS